MDVTASELQSMKDIVDLCVGKPKYTYEMYQQAPRPHGEYAGIKCIASLNPGFDENRLITLPNGEDAFRIIGVRILTFVIVFSRYGDEYINFDNAFYRPDVLQLMKQRKFAAMAKKELTLNMIQLETNWEVRHGIKMQFNVVRDDISQLGIMGDAYVGGKFIEGQKVTDIKG